MRALLRKELRVQRPIFVLGLVLVLLGLVDELTSPDGPKALAHAAIVGTGDAVLLLIISVVLGVQLSNRERDAGTLRFLDGLPTTRGQMFGSMVLAAFCAVAWLPAADIASRLLYHLLDPRSLATEVRPLLLLELFGTQLLVVAVGLGVGAMVGLTGSLSWLCLAALATVYVVAEKRLPWVSMFNPLVALVPHPTGTKLNADQTAVMAQALLALGSLAVAGFGFLRSGRAAVTVPLSVRRPVLGTFVTLLTVGAVVFVVGSQAGSGGDDGGGGSDDEPVAGAHFTVGLPALRQTKHYAFSFPAGASDRASELIDGADAVFEKVVAKLEVPDDDAQAPVDVDLSGSRRNTLGTASLDRIRMRLGEDGLYVLAHESSHVLSRRMAGGSQAIHWNDASALNEGLAEWVAHAVTHENLAQRSDDELILATLVHRKQLDLAAFADIGTVRKTLDEDLQYPAGEQIIEAVARRYGEAAVPKLVHAFGTRSLPNGASGRTLWQAAFQLAGLDLNLVLGDVLRHLAAVADQRADEVSALPRPRGVLVADGGKVAVELKADQPLPEGWKMGVRFRPRDDSEPDQYEYESGEPGDLIYRSSDQVTGGRVCFQLGLTAKSRRTLFEKWNCVDVSAAESLP